MKGTRCELRITRTGKLVFRRFCVVDIGVSLPEARTLLTKYLNLEGIIYNYRECDTALNLSEEGTEGEQVTHVSQDHCETH